MGGLPPRSWHGCTACDLLAAGGFGALVPVAHKPQQCAEMLLQVGVCLAGIALGASGMFHGAAGQLGSGGWTGHTICLLGALPQRMQALLATPQPCPALCWDPFVTMPELSSGNGVLWEPDRGQPIHRAADGACTKYRGEGALLLPGME